jgi:hypothetical protein
MQLSSFSLETVNSGHIKFEETVNSGHIQFEEHMGS